ncbi:MAG: MFS transporter [Acidobacteria bacterium]|nr:MFS transporter [Acidobacteriota bacterium]
MAASAAVTPAVPARTPLTSNQRRAFLAAYGGWTLDGMDAYIYALVLVPALTEILPNSGIQPTPVNVAFYGMVLLAMFLLGWGLSMVWGPIGDKIGRVRALMLTIFSYSLFTFLCGLVGTIWQLAILRILCGIGLGGEQPIGSTFVAEELPEDRRKMAAGVLHTGYYVGFFLAAVANYTIGANFGWRYMFFFGGIPALFITFIRYGVKESRLWHEQFGGAQKRRNTMRQAFGSLFTEKYRRRTTVMAMVYLVSIVGQWAGTIYVPTALTQIANRSGIIGPAAARIASRGGMLLAVGTMLGCLLAPILAERFGRRKAMGMYLSLLAVTTAVSFGYVFYLPNALDVFWACVFLLGFAGANFAMYTLWLPEQFDTSCRASGMSFIASVGRFAGVGMIFLVANGVTYYGSIGTPIALTSIVLFLGLFLLPLTTETRGQPLPR